MIAAIRHNLGVKILSFVLALAIWGFTRASDPIEEWPMQLPVVVRLAPGMALVSRIPETRTVEVYIRGRASQLARLQQSNPKAILDGRTISAGEASTVLPRLEPSPGGVRAEFIQSNFDLIVDAKERTEMTPEEVTEGQLPTGYFIQSRTGIPPAVVVEGAKPLMARVVRVVYYLNLSTISGSTQLSVKFTALDQSGSEIQNLSLIPGTADIGINIAPSQASKTVPVVVDYQGNPAANHALTSLSSDPFLVDVLGSSEALAKVRNVHTAPIDLTGKTTSFEQSVALLLPSQDVALSTSRATIEVQIQQMTARTTFSNLMVETSGSDPAYSYSVSPERVEVVIESPVDMASTITSDLIRPQVDVQGLAPGVYDLRVSANLPADVKLNSVSPETVSVTITAAPGGEAPTTPPAGGPSGGGDSQQGTG
jgi:YbbR domain-containing protein